MANKKIKFPLWLMPDTKATVECLYRQDGCNSQSEFIEKAILFYCGYLQSEYAGDFLPKILGETLEAILSMFGDRIGKLLLKHDSNTAVLAARAESLAQQGFLSAVVCPYISFSLVSTPIFF